MDQLRPESRIAAQEKQTGFLAARIEELSSDTSEELKAIRLEIKQGHMDIGKALDNHADGLMLEIRKQDTRFDKIESDIAELKSDITSIKTTQEQILKLLQQKSGE